MDFQYICEGYPWMDPPVWSGTISPLLPFEPADYEVTAHGSSFHMIISRHSRGKYLCIPDWGIGMDLSEEGGQTLEPGEAVGEISQNQFSRCCEYRIRSHSHRKSSLRRDYRLF